MLIQLISEAISPFAAVAALCLSRLWLSPAPAVALTWVSNARPQADVFLFLSLFPEKKLHYHNRSVVC